MFACQASAADHFPTNVARRSRLRFRRWRPAERISRRSREHRLTVGVLEPPQVTPCAFLKAAVGAAHRPSTEQRTSRFGTWQGLLGLSEAATRMVSLLLVHVEQVLAVCGKLLAGSD